MSVSHRLRTLVIQGVIVFGHASMGYTQHDHDSAHAAQRPVIRFGARAIGLVTHANPGLRGSNLTEAYITQPAISVHAAAAGVQLIGMFNFEGATLERGELNAGIWGE